MGGNVLIVDDSPIDRKIIKQTLQNRFKNIQIFESGDGMDIKSKILSNNIHACILDIMMPVKDGFQVLSEIKATPELRGIPIIVCTGIEDKTAIEKALTLGAYDYFSKPLSEEEIKIFLPLKVKNAIELMKRQEEIIYLSYYDKLTGLYNRRFFDEEIRRIDHSGALPVTVVMGDINGLKLTNDGFGHKTGDNLLVRIAQIMKSECRKGDVLARVGGDEFIIIFPKTDLKQARGIADRIRERLKAERSDPVRPSISFGFATKLHAEEDILTVLNSAEAEMYSNKLLEGKSVVKDIIDTLLKLLFEKTFETREHCKRISEKADMLGKALGLSQDQLNNLQLLSYYHDIGLSALQDNGIDRFYKIHSEIGHRIVSCSQSLAQIADEVLYHHENWDGTGYPLGLKGNEIPMNARILSVVDVYDTLLYGSNEPISEKEALSYMNEQTGKLFDPRIVKVFLKEVCLYKQVK